MAAARTLGRTDLWPWLGVPSGPSLFFDARNIAAAVECSRLGHDPLVDNPCDPWGRAMFYPRAWLVLRWTPLDQRHTVVLGVVVAGLFLLSFLAVLGRLTPAQGAVAALAVCSPPVLFAVERANMDLVVFAGLSLAVMLWARGSPVSQLAAVGVVLVMAVAKLYPVVALAAFWATRRRQPVVAAMAAAVAFGVYALATREDVETITRTATQGQEHSYGARILLGRLYHLVVGDQWEGSRVAAQALVVMAALVLSVAIAAWWRTRAASVGGPVPVQDSSELLAFRMGALVYLGTFVMGNSYDYRLVFLLLLLPQLLEWWDSGWFLGRVVLVVTLAQLWISTFSQELLLWDELLSWLLAGVLVLVILRTLPSLGRLGGARPATGRSAATPS